MYVYERLGLFMYVYVRLGLWLGRFLRFCLGKTAAFFTEWQIK